MDWLLVVEDQIDLWTIIQRALTDLSPPIPTRHAPNVITALSHLHSCRIEGKSLPRFVLSDLYVPERTDGFHLLGAIKSASSGFNHLPVVIMSSSTQDQDRQAVNERGGVYLVKPLTAKEWADFLSTLQYYWRKSTTHIVDKCNNVGLQT
ncbi:response regulator [Spirosoma sp.]|uniref:response regulator n=1 Tax=Spirosoma sp. TaxID=1899569 RepID=UPI00342FF5D7